MPAADGPGAPVVGMVGGGQLARMTCQASIGLGVGFRVLAADPAESAAQVCAGTWLGDYRDSGDLLAFAAGCDVVTFDHEQVPGDRLDALERAGVAIRPGSRALRFAQDKRAMRERLAGMGIACPRFAPVATIGDITEFAAGQCWPVVLKAVSGGYDGRGVWVCGTAAEAAVVLAHSRASGLELIAEEHVAFERELAALVARSPAGQAAAYPVVQTVQRDGICREVLAPAPGLSPGRRAEAQWLALTIAAELGVTGLLAVELFETRGGLLVNELAMRPHNCGHWTIEGAVTSQFEQHLRAVLNLPLGAPGLAARHAVMVNILGGDDPDLHERLTHVMAADPGVKVHLYGKAVRPGRKVGHVTVTGDDLTGLRDRARRAASYLSHGTEQPSADGGQPPADGGQSSADAGPLPAAGGGPPSGSQAEAGA
ncbi:MAG: 5-(carboxyamino)imidazole ribonucleotide synthase [Streptosporangiaceae bacterium]